MKRIGILSDTHGTIDDFIYKHFADCDEIWHAGDIGNLRTFDELSRFKPTRAVFGNIDDHQVRQACDELNRFYCEDTEVLIKHITGYPKRYETSVKNIIKINPPNILIGGHSHILKVIYDKQYNLLFVNPGASGNSGFHKIKTIIKLTINKSDIKDLEIIESKR